MSLRFYNPNLNSKEKINILVIGNGGREHALAWKLNQSKRAGKLFIAPGNGGSSKIAQNVPIKADDLQGLVEFAKKEGIDLVVVGPDDALAAGAVNAFAAVGIAAFGPTKLAARLESSKSFAKQLMKQSGILTADFRVFTDQLEAEEYLKMAVFPLVVKAAGLALGKGVTICENIDQALQAVREAMQEKIFGEAGNEIVVEEFLSGQEVSIHAVCSGESFRMFPSSQDHKQIFSGDKGPNTGGMGTVAPVIWFNDKAVENLGNAVVRPILQQMSSSNMPFYGLLYPGIMVTANGSRVLEFNARFGDPETQVYMRLLKSDLLELIVACVNDRLEQFNLEWHDGVAVCVIAASAGYPGEYQKGKVISGLEQFEKDDDIVVFHAGTTKQGDDYLTSGGRVLGVSALGQDLADARNKAYAAIQKIHFEGMQYRKDIGLRLAPEGY